MRGPVVNMMQAKIAALSSWIDEAPANAARDKEAALWGRVAKVGEEHGEAIAALVGATGQNPRKGRTHGLTDVEKELLDVALTALAAVEHLRGNRGCSIELLDEHVQRVYDRAGLGAPRVEVNIQSVDPETMRDAIRRVVDRESRIRPGF